MIRLFTASRLKPIGVAFLVFFSLGIALVLGPAQSQAAGANTNAASSVAKIEVSPSTAVGGANVTVGGIGFPRNSVGSVYLDTSKVLTGTTNNSGAFKASFKIPSNIGVGNHTVTGVAGTVRASVNLAVTAPSATPTATPTNSPTATPTSGSLPAGWPSLTIADTAYTIPTTGAYFVSPSGSDANPGTLSAPWKTIGHAVSSAPSGSTIVIRQGLYRESVAISGKTLTLQPYPHEQVWMKGSSVVTGWAQSGSVWGVSWSYQPCKTCYDSNAIDPKYPLAGDPNMVFIDGQPLTEVASQSAVTAGTFYVDYPSQKLYIGSDPTNHTVEASQLSVALNITNANGTTVRGLGFDQFAPYYNSDQQSMVRGSSNNLTFEKNTFAWSAVGGLSVFGTNATVDGNTAIDNGMVGITGYGANYMSFTGNHLAYNNQKHFRQDWAAAGAKFSTSSNMTWRNNIAEHNFARGLWCDWVCLNNTIVSNVARYNTSYGIQYEASGNAVIASNLIHHNGDYGIQLIDSSNVNVWNNTLDANQGGIVVLQDSRRTGNSQASGVASGNAIFNNLYSNTGSANDQLETSDYTHTYTGNQMCSGGVDYNAYYRVSSSSPSNNFEWANNTGPNYNTAYATTTDFSSGSGNGRHGIEIDNQSSNPFFKNAASGDYTLVSGSPAANAGVPLPASVASAIGVASGSTVNMGALIWPAS